MRKICAVVLIIVLAGCKYHAPIPIPEDSADAKAAKALLATVPAPVRIAGKAYFFGDSITQGYNGSGVVADNWVALVASFVGWDAANLGIGGTTMERFINGSPSLYSMYVRSVTEMPAKTAADKYIFLAYGINDVGYNTSDLTVTQFTSDYRFVLDKAFAQGWQPKDIVLVNIYYCNEPLLFRNTDASTTGGRLAAFNTAIKAMADEKGTRFIDINTFMKTNGAGYLLSADGVHPNNTGFAVIARGVEEAIRGFQ
jgi:lysophospholipase L1-like esterase